MFNFKSMSRMAAIAVGIGAVVAGAAVLAVRQARRGMADWMSGCDSRCDDCDCPHDCSRCDVGFACSGSRESHEEDPCMGERDADDADECSFYGCPDEEQDWI